jgi:hypothetical protein
VQIRKRNSHKISATSLMKGKERILMALLKSPEIGKDGKRTIQIKLALTTNKYKF